MCLAALHLLTLLLASAQSPDDGCSLNTTVAVGDGLATSPIARVEYTTSVVETGMDDLGKVQVCGQLPPSP